MFGRRESGDAIIVFQILMENKGVFAGVMIEWVGPDACVSVGDGPSVNHLHLIEMATTKRILRYFVREQDFGHCHTENPIFLGPNSLVNGTLPFPKEMQPVFSCFAGQEGLCFKSFHKYPEEACSTDQVGS